MRHRRRAAVSGSSGLVPMADMLSNTVGIMLFILAFTVLQTGGVLVPKRLPVERKTDTRAVYFVCRHGRLMPLDANLWERLTDRLGSLRLDTLAEWNAGLSRAHAEDKFFSVIPDGKARYEEILQSGVGLDLVAEYWPKDDVGDTIERLDQEDSLFQQSLQVLSPNDRFVYFFVYPDSLELFRKARECAEVRFRLGSGWGPASTEKPIRFNISGGGRGIQPVEQ